MSKLYIPACGDRITLAQPWQFTLYLEHRNLNFAEAIGIDHSRYQNTGYAWRAPLDTVSASLPEGTVLECDRIYIRSTSKSAASAEESYDSVTWKVVINDKPSRNQRFWVKLSDCSNLEYEPDSISTYRDRK